MLGVWSRCWPARRWTGGPRGPAAACACSRALPVRQDGGSVFRPVRGAGNGRAADGREPSSWQQQVGVSEVITKPGLADGADPRVLARVVSSAALGSRR